MNKLWEVYFFLYEQQQQGATFFLAGSGLVVSYKDKRQPGSKWQHYKQDIIAILTKNAAYAADNKRIFMLPDKLRSKAPLTYSQQWMMTRLPAKLPWISYTFSVTDKLLLQNWCSQRWNIAWQKMVAEHDLLRIVFVSYKEKYQYHYISKDNLSDDWHQWLIADKKDEDCYIAECTNKKPWQGIIYKNNNDTLHLELRVHPWLCDEQVLLRLWKAACKFYYSQQIYPSSKFQYGDFSFPYYVQRKSTQWQLTKKKSIDKLATLDDRPWNFIAMEQSNDQPYGLLKKSISNHNNDLLQQVANAYNVTDGQLMAAIFIKVWCSLQGYSDNRVWFLRQHESHVVDHDSLFPPLWNIEPCIIKENCVDIAALCKIITALLLTNKYLGTAMSCLTKDRITTECIIEIADQQVDNIDNKEYQIYNQRQLYIPAAVHITFNKNGCFDIFFTREVIDEKTVQHIAEQFFTVLYNVINNQGTEHYNDELLSESLMHDILHSKSGGCAITLQDDYFCFAEDSDVVNNAANAINTINTVNDINSSCVTKELIKNKYYSCLKKLEKHINPGDGVLLQGIDSGVMIPWALAIWHYNGVLMLGDDRHYKNLAKIIVNSDQEHIQKNDKMVSPPWDKKVDYALCVWSTATEQLLLLTKEKLQRRAHWLAQRFSLHNCQQISCSWTLAVDFPCWWCEWLHAVWHSPCSWQLVKNNTNVLSLYYAEKGWCDIAWQLPLLTSGDKLSRKTFYACHHELTGVIASILLNKQQGNKVINDNNYITAQGLVWPQQQVFILGRNRQLLPFAVQGNIWVAGENIADVYKLTANAWLPEQGSVNEYYIVEEAAALSYRYMHQLPASWRGYWHGAGKLGVLLSVMDVSLQQSGEILVRNF